MMTHEPHEQRAMNMNLCTAACSYLRSISYQHLASHTSVKERKSVKHSRDMYAAYLPMSFSRVVAFISIISSCNALRASVFGASGGVGQLICNTLMKTDGIDSVIAVSRSAKSLAAFELLNGCTFVEADALQIDTLRPALSGADYVIISVGTTAFPTKKWDNGNDPQTACVKTVETILQSISDSRDIPKKIVLLSSIGVETVDKMPFKLLNSFGVLDAKRQSEELLFRKSEELGFDAIVVRPGRLVGAPFTNFDLAKLLKLDQGSNKGIIIDRRDVLAGDCERADVATAIGKCLISDLASKKNLFSIINKPGNAPSDMDWGRMLSLLTVSETDLLNTRSS